jgi:hypothetical protein
MRRPEDGWLIKARGTPAGALVRVVAPRVPLDEANTQALCSLLAPFLSAGYPCRLTVVLGNVVYVPGFAPRAFAWMCERLRAGGGRLTLRGAPDGLCEEAVGLGLTQALGIRRRGAGAARPGTPAGRADACPPLGIGP